MVRGISILASGLLIALATPIFAQQNTPSLPRNPAMWLNSSPIPDAALKGKAAMLFFFEEG